MMAAGLREREIVFQLSRLRVFLYNMMRMSIKTLLNVVLKTNKKYLLIVILQIHLAFIIAFPLPPTSPKRSKNATQAQ